MNEEELQKYFESLGVDSALEQELAKAGLTEKEFLEAEPEEELSKAAEESTDQERIEQALRGRQGLSEQEMVLVENPPLLCYYAPESKDYRYVLPNQAEFHTTVPLGGWTRSAVELTIPKSMTVLYIYKDGELQSSENLTFRGIGEYAVMMQENIYGGNGAESYRFVVPFHIDGNSYKQISLLTAPEGMQIQKVLKDGTESAAKGKYLSLQQDGTYQVTFEDSEGVPCYTLDFQRDTTAPSIRFSRDIQNVVTAPMNFSLSESSARLQLFRNGREVTASQGRIAESGAYEAIVSDLAGNQRSYTFLVDLSAHRIQFNLVMALGMLLVFVGVSFFYWRRRMRVI